MKRIKIKEIISNNMEDFKVNEIQIRMLDETPKKTSIEKPDSLRKKLNNIKTGVNTAATTTASASIALVAALGVGAIVIDPVDDIIDFVVDTVKIADANPCPPVVLGVGIGSDFEGVALLSKRALCRDISVRNNDDFYKNLEEKMLQKINELHIGPQGFGGEITALAVNIETAPTHIAGLPVAVNVGCHVTRHSEAII